MTHRLLSVSTLYPAPPRPGFGRFVQNQMESLARRGDWDVTVINPIGLPPLLRLARYAALRTVPPMEVSGGVTVHHPRFALLPGVVPTLTGRFNPALVTRAILPLARRLHAETPFDMVDAQFFYPDGPAAARIARALNIPLAIKARGGDILYWGAIPGAREQIRQAANQASVVLSVSEALAQDMVALGLPADRMRVHYTGLDHTRFYPRPRDAARAALASRLPALALPEGARIVACVGNLIRLKNQLLAIAAMAQLPDDIVLVLVGGGPDEANLRHEVNGLGLNHRVYFAGALGHDDLPLMLSAAEAMVLASEREGLANAWIEALACGAPIVISDVGGAREVIDRPAAGRLVDRNPQAIAEGLRDVLAARYSQADVAEVASRFSWETNAARLAEIYTSIVS